MAEQVSATNLVLPTPERPVTTISLGSGCESISTSCATSLSRPTKDVFSGPLPPAAPASSGASSTPGVVALFTASPEDLTGGGGAGTAAVALPRAPARLARALQVARSDRLGGALRALLVFSWVTRLGSCGRPPARVSVQQLSPPGGAVGDPRPGARRRGRVPSGGIGQLPVVPAQPVGLASREDHLVTDGP